MHEKCIGALVIDTGHLLDEFLKVDNLLREIDHEVRPFKYPHLLAERV